MVDSCALVHIERDKYGNYIFLDSDNALKYCSSVSHSIKTIDYSDTVQEDIPSIKFNQLRDRFLVRINDHVLREYTVSNSIIAMSKELTEEKSPISDFCYFHKKPMKAEGVEIVIVTESGVLKRTCLSTGKSRRFMISNGMIF